MIGWSPVLATNGGNTMVRKVIIALAAVTFAGAMSALTPADARMGGGFRGGGVLCGVECSGFHVVGSRSAWWWMVFTAWGFERVSLLAHCVGSRISLRV